ncbi:hypothetical protein IP90_02223 [Luteimonas cucumeris]|uniref:VWA7 N-terminal domain-containing protein n=2 Tax=Luteimonas cucumeris TaxID=985012 RepID=A0A562L2H5_9GAMM|nr:hypothetical protein IP90_02223 [Luteimonas cucumeris]
MHASRSKTAVPVGMALSILIAGMLGGMREAPAFGSGIHERITRNAFPFMAGNVLDTIVAGNLDEDEDAAENLAERHAQNCRFRDSAAYINLRYEEVVGALRSPSADDPNRAARLFGHILHGVQDFYSHSNWIPTPPQGLGIRGRLLDSGLGLWTLPTPYSILFDDVAYVEGDAQKPLSVRLPVDADGKVSSAVPIVRDPRGIISTPQPREYRGLMTSGAPRHPGDQRCPLVAESCNISSAENVCLRHGDSRSEGTSSRNFDGAGRMNLDGGGDGDWAQARHHAKLATRHEWCRLLHLSRDLDPSYVASGRLLGNWVGRDSAENTLHIAGTPCQRGASRSHLIEITATPSASAPSVVPFVLFRSDFSSSARTSVSRESTKTLRVCGNPGERLVAALVPARTPGAIHVVQVPATAYSRTIRDHRGGFDVTFAVRVTPNAC